MTTATIAGFRRKRKTLFDADDLLHLPTNGRRLELVKGKIYEMAPAGARHGSVALRVAARLQIHVDNLGLGQVFAAETGFKLGREPDTVRAPDASFVSSERLPEGDLPDGFLELAPDLAVEVVSLNDRRREILEKALAWLAAGTSEVWVLYPTTRTVTLYRSQDDIQELSEEDDLDGERVLPGFVYPVRLLFS